MACFCLNGCMNKCWAWQRSQSTLSSALFLSQWQHLGAAVKSRTKLKGLCTRWMAFKIFWCSGWEVLLIKWCVCALFKLNLKKKRTSGAADLRHRAETCWDGAVRRGKIYRQVRFLQPSVSLCCSRSGSTVDLCNKPTVLVLWNSACYLFLMWSLQIKQLFSQDCRSLREPVSLSLSFNMAAALSTLKVSLLEMTFINFYPKASNLINLHRFCTFLDT